MMLRNALVALAIIATASAQRKRFEICAYSKPDCSDVPFACGDDRDDGVTCLKFGLPGIGVTSDCSTETIVLYEENKSCSGGNMTYTVAPGACIPAEFDGKSFFFKTNCDFVAGQAKTPTAGPETDPVDSPAPATSEAPAASAAPSSAASSSSAAPSASMAPTEEPAASESPKPVPMNGASESPAPGSSASPVGGGDSGTSGDGEDGAEDYADDSVTDDENDDGEGSDDGSVCFDSESTVLMQSGDRKPLTDVVAGDFVESVDSAGERTFSEVFLVQHTGVSKTVKMVDISVEGSNLRVTPSHYLRIPGTSESYSTAGKLAVGDMILIAGSDGMVEKEVQNIKASRGAPRNVHTMNDRIVVDNVVASCVSSNPVLGIDTLQIRMMLAPLKMMHRFGFSATVNSIDQAIYKAYNSVKSN